MTFCLRALFMLIVLVIIDRFDWWSKSSNVFSHIIPKLKCWWWSYSCHAHITLDTEWQEEGSIFNISGPATADFVMYSRKYERIVITHKAVKDLPRNTGQNFWIWYTWCRRIFEALWIDQSFYWADQWACNQWHVRVSFPMWSLSKLHIKCISHYFENTRGNNLNKFYWKHIENLSSETIRFSQNILIWISWYPKN